MQTSEGPLVQYNATFILFSSSLSQDLLDCLLFFQQKCAHDTLLDAVGADSTTISTRNSSLPLLQRMVLRGFNVLDALE